MSSASSFAISLDPALRRYRLAVLDQRGTGQVGRPAVPQPAAAALAGPVHAPGGRQLREPHRAAPRLLHDRRHGARHRRPAPGARRGQDRAHGDLVRHPRRAAVRARLPRARRPADPGLDRRPRRPRRLPARHLPQPAARARRAVRPRRLSQRDQGPGGRRGRARAPHQRERPAARRLLRRAAASAAPPATPRPTSCPSCSSRATSTRSCRPRCRRPSAPRAAATPRRCMRLRRIGQGGATRAEDLSFGLNVATGCTDVTLPFPRTAPVADRAAAAQAALAAIPPDRLRPFDAADRAAHELRRRLPGLAGRRDPPAVHRAAARRAGAAARRAPGHAHAAGERARHGAGAAARDDRRPEGLGPRRPRQRHHGLHRAGAGALHRRRRCRSPLPGPGQRRAADAAAPALAARLPLGAGRRRHPRARGVRRPRHPHRRAPQRAAGAVRRAAGAAAAGCAAGASRGRRASMAACACTATRSSRACASPARSPPARA